jgi:hypothetical protein
MDEKHSFDSRSLFTQKKGVDDLIALVHENTFDSKIEKCFAEHPELTPECNSTELLTELKSSSLDEVSKSCQIQKALHN